MVLVGLEAADLDLTYLLIIIARIFLEGYQLQANFKMTSTLSSSRKKTSKEINQALFNLGIKYLNINLLQQITLSHRAKAISLN